MIVSLNSTNVMRACLGRIATGFTLVVAALTLTPAAHAQTPPQSCARMLTADVVAIDMPLMWNRLGAQNINGMMYALKRDVINVTTNKPLTAGGSASPGNVALRPDKRPRPLVLRMGAGDCMEITLTNLLSSNKANPFHVGTTQDPNGICAVGPDISDTTRSDIPFNCHNDDQVAEREISLRFQHLR